MNSSKVNFNVIIMCIILMHVFISNALPCDSCGSECSNACGTKHFRTCCFNYLRKRSDPNVMKSISNKRLIDFILLQGHAMYSLNDLSREHDEQLLKEAALAAVAAAAAETPKYPNAKIGLHGPPLYYD